MSAVCYSSQGFDYPEKSGQFCFREDGLVLSGYKNLQIMDTKELMKLYGDLERELCVARAYEDPALDFEMLCRRIGAPPRLMDRLLWQELGTDGAGLIESYRSKVA